MSVKDNLLKVLSSIPKDVTLVAISKTKPVSDIQEAYESGQRIFGENKVQELTEKHEVLPKDIEWHMVGHLQSNKVKYIAPFVSLIHAVDSVKLLKEINKRGKQNERVINCLLQVKIAKEESKFGLTPSDCKELLALSNTEEYSNVRVTGLMGMATNSNDNNLIKEEFKLLNNLYKELKNTYQLSVLSMGMSGDYPIAIDSGSNMIRVGSSIFGNRNYN